MPSSCLFIYEEECFLKNPFLCSKDISEVSSSARE
jgi:hypothetical protein